MRQDPAISVIIPAYNCERYIGLCVSSLLDQRFTDFEIVIVDDGSTDGTGAILDGFAGADARVVVLRQANAGTPAARNAGMDAARGEYIAFVDADDSVEPGYLEHLFTRARATGADVVSGGYTLWREDKIIDRCPAAKWDVALGQTRVSLMCVPTTRLYRASFLKDHGIRFTTGERFEVIAFSLAVNLTAARIENIPQNDYRYYKRPQSFTDKLKRGQIPAALLPKRAIRDVVERLATSCDRDILEFCVVKILAGVLFDNLRRHPTGTVDDFSAFSAGLMREFFPGKRKNPYIRLFSPREMPFVQRAAMKVFALAIKSGTLRAAARAVTRL